MFKLFNNFITKTTATPAARPMIDVLEDRRLLSVSVLDHDVAPMPADTSSMTVSAAALSLKGTYKGGLKITGLPQAIPLTMIIKRQTASAVKGTLSAAGTAPTAFSSKLKNGNTISGNFSQAGATGTFTIQFSATGKASGTLNLLYNGQKITGTITLKRA